MTKRFLKGDGAKTALVLTCGFALVFLCLCAAFGFVGAGFSGERSILISDMKSQYIDFFAALRNGDVFYTDGLGLSGSFAGTFAYYLSSPFSLLIFLFPAEKLQTALLLIIFLKLSSASVSFGIIQFRMTKKTDLSLLIFPACYALMSFGFFFFINLFWLDALIWLPPLALSVIKLAETGKCRMLPPLLAVLFISNFYISYMTGLFLLLFFLAEATAKSLPAGDILKRGLKLAGSAAAAFGMSAFLLFPAFKDFLPSLGEESFDGYGSLNFTPKQFLLKLFPGAYDSIGNSAAPTVFCGVLVLILAGGFFFLKNVNPREKICYGSLALVMSASFLLPPLDRIWHAFAFPNAFAYRYAFCFSFLLVFLALRAFTNLGALPRFYLPLWLIPPALIFLFRERLLNNLPRESISLASAAILIYAALIYCLIKTRFAVPVLTAALLLFNTAELLLNGALILRNMNRPDTETGYPFPLYAEWVSERAALTGLLDEIPDRDLFRTADAERENTGAALGFNGVSAFSSCYSPKIQKLFRAFGYEAAFKYYTYVPGSPETDAIFSVRRVISRQEGGDMEGYIKTASRNGVSLYEVPNAWPPLFPASAEVKSMVLSERPDENRKALYAANLSLRSSQSSGEAPAHSIEVTEWDGGAMRAAARIPSPCVLQTTLPYDRNYGVFANGEKLKTYETLGALLAADLPSGDYEITVTYTPKEALAGGAVSVLSLVAWIFWPKLRKKRSEKQAPS